MTTRATTDQKETSRFVELSSSDASPQQTSLPAFEDVPFNESLWPPWLESNYVYWNEDRLATDTSDLQFKTQKECMQYLLLEDTDHSTTNSHGLPHLNRQGHIRFLHTWLDKLPAPYQAMDAARPWFFYWVFQALTVLGEDVSQYRERLLQTLTPLQNATGGFAGGFGQMSHCATTYGCVLALAMVDGLDMIDRKSMWHFLGQVKQADGGFQVAVMAEEDIRGAYCAMTIITLLNLPLELPPDSPARNAGLTSFLDGLGDWISRCQTYEGGIGGAPTNEAHGAYAFCALACLSIIDAPQRSISKYLDISALLKWIVDIQTTPEGGFAGRTNKLVDSCYSHWVGGCWALLEAALNKDSLWNRSALIRYLLTCCQQPLSKTKAAGMRDKPSARPDAYHTCYSLAGLSAATNHYHLDSCKAQCQISGRCDAPFHWTSQSASQEELRSWCIDPEDTVLPVHPVFVIPFDVVSKTARLFEHGGL